METGNWLRLGAILALILGSIYVLLPTILQEDAATRHSRSVGAVEAPKAPTAVDLDVELAVPGDATTAAAALRERLSALGIRVANVAPAGDRVEVRLAAGTSAASVVAAAAVPGEAAFYPLDAAVPADVPAPAEGADPLASVPAPAADALRAAFPDAPGRLAAAASLAGAPAPAGLTPVAGIGRLDPSSGAFTGAPAESGAPLLVAIDGRIRGLAVWETPEGGSPGLVFRPLEAGADAAALLGSPALPPGITEVADTGAESVTVRPTGGPAAEEPSKLPPWLAGILPDTRMNLGIDLQGGIDLTLQVDLDEAVMSRVNRDAGALRNDIAREFGEGATEAPEEKTGGGFLSGCNGSGAAVDPGQLDAAWQGTRVTPDRDDPVLRVESDVDLADIQGFVARQVEGYTYTASDTADSGRPVHLFEMDEASRERIAEEATDQVLETLRKRIDATGVKEPSIVRKGPGAINVQLPGQVDLQQAVAAIGTTAVLEFLLVEEELETTLRERGMTPVPLEEMLREAERQMPPDQYADDDLLNRFLQDRGHLPRDRVVAWQYTDTPGEKLRVEGGAYALKVDDDPLTGADVSHAGVAFDQTQQAVVSLEFKSRGSNKFCELTSANVGKRFAILLDEEVQSAPNIKDSICGGRAQIEMGGGLDPLAEANTLALVLRTGSLNAPVTIGDVRTVGSTLGADAIRKGMRATLVGAGLVLVFMLGWYRTAGVIANIALAVNVLIMMSALALFGATLTLPGIAGVALTIGMAVDANIIIYERIKEELALGVHVRKAVDAGFDKALSAIVDGNLTTAIAGIVLFSYGTGPIKGFAVTLLVGIVTTLITALFVTRSLMDVATRSSTARLKI